MDVLKKPQKRGTGKQSPVSRPPKKPKLKIPEKGRIRFVLVLVLLIFAAVRFGGAIFSGGPKSAGGAVRQSSPSIKKDRGDSAGNQEKKSLSRDDKNNAAKPEKKPRFSWGRRSRRDMADKDKAGAHAPDLKNVDKAIEKKPDYLMTFDDVRRLVIDNNMAINASEQTIVIENTKHKHRSFTDNDKKPLAGAAISRPPTGNSDTLTLFLSIDTSLQKYAMSMFKRYRPRYAAAAAIDPQTGRVLALASFADEGEEMGGDDLYRKGVFPAASVFKTIVAAAGIEKGGMNRNTAIPHFGGNHTLYRSQIQKDLKVSKDITLQDAFAYSVNPAFARIALFNVSKDVVAEYGVRFGFNERFPFEFDADVSEMFAPDSDFSVAEFASGFNRRTSISPLFGAMLAGAVCRGGVICQPAIVDSIRSSGRDTLVYAREPRVWRRAVRESTASELGFLMTGVTHYGTARRTFRPLRDSPRFGKYEYGGKTGSVNKFGLGKVDWFVGFARDPNDKSRQIAVGVVTTHGEYWTVHSSYIASELFKRHIITGERKRGLVD